MAQQQTQAVADDSGGAPRSGAAACVVSITARPPQPRGDDCEEQKISENLKQASPWQVQSTNNQKRLVTNYFEFAAKFTQIDLYGSSYTTREQDQVAQRNKTCKNRPRFFENQFTSSKWYLENNRVWWVQVYSFLLMLCLLHMILNLVLQYRHLFLLVQLEQIQKYYSSDQISSTNNSTDANTHDREIYIHLEAQRIKLEAKLERAARDLEFAGVPNHNYRFIIECFYCEMIIITVFSYFGSRRFYSRRAPLNFHCFRNVLHHDEENVAIYEYICKIIKIFVESKRNFMTKSCRGRVHALTATNLSKNLASRCTCFNLSGFAQKPWEETSDLLQEMLSSDQLTPETQSQSWIEAQSSFLFKSVVGSLLSTSGYSIVLSFVFFSNIYESGYVIVNLIQMFESSVIFFTVAFAMTLCIFSVAFGGWNQVSLAQRLNNSLGACIERNYRRSKFIRSLKHGSSTKQLHTLMDADILRCLMRYKIFVANYKQLKLSFGWTAQICFVLMFVYPTLVVFHVTYANEEALKQFRVVASIMYLISFAIGSIILLLFCSIYSHFTCVHKSLWSLLASSIDISQQNKTPAIAQASTATPLAASSVLSSPSFCHYQTNYFVVKKLSSQQQQHQGKEITTITTSKHVDGDEHNDRIFDEHTILSIRRELDYPDKTIVEFATKLYGSRVTFSSMLRLYFWFGILVQPMFTKPTASNSSWLANFARDPLGLFKRIAEAASLDGVRASVI